MGVTTPCAGEVAKIDAEVKGTYRSRRGAWLHRGERSGRRAFPEARAGAAERRGGEGGSWSRRGRRESVPTRNGSGSHFQVDESAVPPVACRFAFSVDQAGGLPVPAGAKGAGYLSPRIRARMAELQLTQADLAGIAGSWKRGPGHDQGSREISRRDRRPSGRKTERDSHRRG